MQYKDLLDYKIKQKYFDLPDENYAPIRIVTIIENLNKIFFSYSIGAIIWFVNLWMLSNRFYVAFLMWVFALFLCSLALVMTQSKQNRDNIYFGFAVFSLWGLSVWFIKFS